METPVAVAEVGFDKKSTELSSEEDLEFYCAKGTHLIIEVYDPEVSHDCGEDYPDYYFVPLDTQESHKYSALPHFKCAPKRYLKGTPCIIASDEEDELAYDYIIPSKTAEEYMRIKMEYLESKKSKAA